MTIVYIYKKKINHFIFLLPHNKILAHDTIDPLEKNPRDATVKDHFANLGMFFFLLFIYYYYL